MYHGKLRHIQLASVHRTEALHRKTQLLELTLHEVPTLWTMIQVPVWAGAKAPRKHVFLEIKHDSLWVGKLSQWKVRFWIDSFVEWIWAYQTHTHTHTSICFGMADFLQQHMTWISRQARRLTWISQQCQMYESYIYIQDRRLGYYQVKRPLKTHCQHVNQRSSMLANSKSNIFTLLELCFTPKFDHQVNSEQELSDPKRPRVHSHKHIWNLCLQIQSVNVSLSVEIDGSLF